MRADAGRPATRFPAQGRAERACSPMVRMCFHAQLPARCGPSSGAADRSPVGPAARALAFRAAPRPGHRPSSSVPPRASRSWVAARSPTRELRDQRRPRPAPGHRGDRLPARDARRGAARRPTRRPAGQDRHEDRVQRHRRAAFTAATPPDVGGRTLTAGIYRTGSVASLGLTGTLTLDAEGDPDAVFIFQIESTLVTATDSSVSLANGAQACNVYWQVGSSATLGTRTAFKGTILALTSISLNDAVVVRGRLLARNGAVTLINDTVTRSQCAVPATPEPGTPSGPGTTPEPGTTPAGARRPVTTPGGGTTPGGTAPGGGSAPGGGTAPGGGSLRRARPGAGRAPGRGSGRDVSGPLVRLRWPGEPPAARTPGPPPASGVSTTEASPRASAFATPPGIRG